MCSKVRQLLAYCCRETIVIFIRCLLDALNLGRHNALETLKTGNLQVYATSSTKTEISIKDRLKSGSFKGRGPTSNQVGSTKCRCRVTLRTES